MATVTFDSGVQGYHTFKAVCNPIIGGMLTVKSEFGNSHDLHTVAVVSMY